MFAALVGATVAGCSGLARQDAAEWQAQPAAEDYRSIMSFNILVGGWPTESVLDTIGDASPDILCLQEVTPGFAARFAREMADSYPHRFVRPGQMAGGIAIASRHPLANRKVLPLGLPYFPALAADIELETGTIQVACVHFMPPFAKGGEQMSSSAAYQRNKTVRVEQARRLIEHLDTAGKPAIVLGDMNEWPGQAALEMLGEAGFEDACLQVDSRCGPTWPGAVVSWPTTVRIDHILGRGVEFRQAAVIETGGSDHYPVAARFRPDRLLSRVSPWPGN